MKKLLIVALMAVGLAMVQVKKVHADSTIEILDFWDCESMIEILD